MEGKADSGDQDRLLGYFAGSGIGSGCARQRFLALGSPWWLLWRPLVQLHQLVHYGCIPVALSSSHAC